VADVASEPRLRLLTEESIYGTVLVNGILVAAGVDTALWHLFVSVLGTVVVFWAAHVYAGTVVGYGRSGHHSLTLGTAFRRSMLHSVGLLTAALPPCVVLLLGALRVVPDAAAVWGALWLGVGILGVCGYRAFQLRGSSATARILGCLGTAALGLAMVVLKAVIH
jgi:hypothetical protein